MNNNIKDLKFLDLSLFKAVKKEFDETNKKSKNNYFSSFINNEELANDILFTGIYNHRFLLNKPDSGKIAYLYLQRRLGKSATYLMEDKNFTNIQSIKLYHKITPLMLKILYCYCNTEEIFVFKEDSIQFEDTRNEVFYNDRRYKLSYEQVNVAPDCDDIYIKIEEV